MVVGLVCGEARAIAGGLVWWLRQSQPEVETFPTAPPGPAWARKAHAAWGTERRG